MADIPLHKPLLRLPSRVGSSSPCPMKTCHSRTTIRDAKKLEALAHQSKQHSPACSSGVEVETVACQASELPQITKTEAVQRQWRQFQEAASGQDSEYSFCSSGILREMCAGWNNT